MRVNGGIMVRMAMEYIQLIYITNTKGNLLTIRGMGMVFLDNMMEFSFKVIGKGTVCMAVVLKR